jgi:signal peptidase I
MNTKFSAQTDQPKKITLDSGIVSCAWKTTRAVGGGLAAFKVKTSLVGEGSQIQVIGRSENGKKLGKIKGEVSGNSFPGAFDIPEKIDRDDLLYFEVKLPKLGLSAESGRIPVMPHIQVKSIAWDRQEARRGDIVGITAEFDNVANNTRATVIIYEYDQDGNHDPIVKIPAMVKNGKLDLQWEYEYFEDTDEIPTDEEMKKYGGSYNPPEYFFVIVIEGARIGVEQESGLLTFKDWITLELVDENGDPIPERKFIIRLPDGSENNGTLDSNGKATIENLPPGPCEVEYPE